MDLDRYQEIARYGILQSPALLINQRLVAVGRGPTKTELTEWIKRVSTPPPPR